MWNRLLAALTLALLPIAVSAEGALTPPLSGSSSLQQQPAASEPGSSNAASSLQPAGNAPLQSTGGASGGLVAPNSSQLQAPVSDSEQLRIWLDSETGGSAASDSPWQLSLTWIGLGVGLIGLAAGLLWLRAQLRPRSAATPPDQPEDSGNPPA